ncbi:DUF6197 family protein [Hyphomicrobium sp.]|jgi:hypothetical protein|uniref:DUF6197 family protein n=1 Tax=Hyphomicrobium sp. TaxID=82 RepID=UPI003BB872E3
MSRPISRQIISRALETLSDQRRWTMRAAVSRSQNNVVQYCAFGALAYAANEYAASVSEARELALRAEAAVVNANRWPPGTRISQFNDSNTHEDVIAALRCAAQS